MPAFYPPVLETKARAIPFISKPANDDFFEIEFAMPSINVLTDIGHVQVSIKYQSTNESAVNSDFSPDSQVLYIKRSEGGAYFKRKDNGNYVIQIPYRCFDGARPKEGTTYTVQVRFGANTLWDPATNGLDGIGFGAFAAWRNYSTSQVPSAFGEWSNLQTVYCYGEAAESLEYNLHDFVPELVYSYAPKLDDPLAQVRVVYEYADMYGSRFNTLVFNGQYQQDGSYVMQCKLPIAPVQTIFVSVEATTKNNTVRGKTLTIFPLKNTQEIPNLGGKMEDAQLTGEELGDGILAKDVTLTYQLTGTETISLYRSNVYTLETVKVSQGIKASQNTVITIKDFSVEMGEDYQYVACYVNKDGVVMGTVINPYPWGYENKGYARLMDMDSTVFLTTRKHQLRLQGAVNVTSFKRNTQDNFQTTIGSKYPFYSRNAQTNYRTFSLSGLVSINFDPTATFLRNDKDNGLWWDNDNGSKLVVLNRDLYGETQFSISRRRLHEMAKEENESIYQLGTESSRDVFGPMSIYDDYYFRNITRNLDTSKKGENFYIERKFRDFVMEWLSDGKPKLFRSETEGNMIVMISGASFTPQDKSARMTYNLSCTVTEIAEYDLENLINYDLIPCEIKSQAIEGFPTHLNQGDIISNEDYLTIIFYENKDYKYWLENPDPDDPTRGDRLEEEQRLEYLPGYAYNAFSPYGNEWYVNGAKLDLINKILKTITEFRHIRGDFDPYVYTGLIYQFNRSFNIPDTISGTEITPINTMLGVKNITPNKINYDEQYTEVSILTFSVSDGQLPPGLKLNPETGVIYGAPTHTDTNAPRMPDSITLKVVESIYKKDFNGNIDYQNPIVDGNADGQERHRATMVINVGYIYSELIFEPINRTIPITIVGKQIVPIDISQFVKGGVKFSQLEDSTSNIGYLWTAIGLPAGLSIDENGFIKGAFLSPVKGGFATITVSDGVGQVKQQLIEYGEGVQQIFFQDSLDFNLGWSEVGVPIVEKNLSSGVTGGYKSEDTDTWPTGYKFSAQGLPPGIDIDPATGIISGTPTQAVAAGTARIRATDFGNPQNYDEIEIIYQEVVPAFIFTDSATYDIDPYKDGSPMNLGLTIAPINLMAEGFEAVTGGLPFNDEPHYRFTSERLIPDFSIDNYGVITGRASVGSDPREAKIWVEDARGERRSITINIVKIQSKLSFREPVQSTIPESYVNQPNEIILSIPYEYIQGGQDPYTMEVSDGLPSGLTATTTVHYDGSKTLDIRGVPKAPMAAHNIVITISDSSKEVETITYNIPCAEIYAELNWNQPADKKLDLENTVEDEEIKIYIDGVYGGKPPYSIKVSPDYLFYPLEIKQDEMAEDTPGTADNPNNNFYISGYVTERNANQAFQIIITDALGQSVQDVLNVGKAGDAFILNLLNSMGGLTLIAGKSEIHNLQVCQASGGTPGVGNPYEYHISTDGTKQVFDPNVELNFTDGTISTRSGETIRNPVSAPNNIRDLFYAYDNGGVEPKRTASSIDNWFTPKVLEQPYITALVVNKTFNVPILNVDDPYNSGQLIAFGTYDQAEWQVSNPDAIPPGLSWANGSIIGTVTNVSDPGDTDLILHIPARSMMEGHVTTPEIELRISVHFEGVFSTMSLGTPDNMSYDFWEVGVPIEEKNVAEKLYGGVGPYSWEIVGTPPQGIGLSTNLTQTRNTPVYLTGTPKQYNDSAILITIRVTDNQGTSREMDFDVKGILNPIVFTDSPALDIPAMNANTDITPIDVSAYVSGGSGNFNYSITNASPYGFSATQPSVLQGNSGSTSFPPRIATITVQDAKHPNQKKSVDISVGQITGSLAYYKQDGHKITGTTAGQTGTLNIANGVIGGVTPITYEINSRPAGWTDANVWIANPNQGTLNYKLPASGTAAGTIKVNIKDASNTVVIAEIPTAAIS